MANRGSVQGVLLASFKVIERQNYCPTMIHNCFHVALTRDRAILIPIMFQNSLSSLFSTGLDAPHLPTALYVVCGA